MFAFWLPRLARAYRGAWSRRLLLLLCALTGSYLTACGVFAGRSPGANDVLFEEPFDDPMAANWQLESDAQGQAQIADGKLLVTIGAPGTVQYTTLENEIFSDLILDVEATQVGGVPGSSYGVLLRMVAPQQFYRFEITSSGEYIVERHDGPGEWERLTDDWQTSPAIRAGLNETNHLRVAVAGGTFSFYVNETLLTQVVDQRYQTGAIAFDAGTFNQSDVQVAFDNVLVQAP